MIRDKIFIDFVKGSRGVLSLNLTVAIKNFYRGVGNAYCTN